MGWLPDPGRFFTAVLLFDDQTWAERIYRIDSDRYDTDDEVLVKHLIEQFERNLSDSFTTPGPAFERVAEIKTYGGMPSNFIRIPQDLR